MSDYFWEKHSIKDPLLPFILHKKMVVTSKISFPHWHNNLELLYCYDGSGFVICNAVKFPLKPGELFIVNCSETHAIVSDTSVSYSCLIIDESFTNSNGLDVCNLSFQNAIFDDEINALFQRILDEFDSDGKFKILEIRRFVLNFLSTLCTRYVKSCTAIHSPKTLGYVKKSMTYIMHHINGYISLGDIANELGISKHYLARIFKSVTGITIFSFINTLRCERAKELLLDNISIADISEKLCFGNVAYFTSVFKKQIGTSPAEWRKQNNHK